MGGGVMRMVGTGGIVNSPLFVTVLGSVGTRFSVLGSEKQKKQGLRETG